MSEGRNRKWIAGRAMAWVIGIAVGVPGAAGVSQAQTQAQAAAKPAPTALRTAPLSAPQAERASAGGTKNGITVHGWWVIEVKNPDGTVVNRREFENHLETGSGTNGGYNLTSLLSGYLVAGPFVMILPVPCEASTDYCILSQTGSAGVYNYPTTTIPIASDLQQAFGGAKSVTCNNVPAGVCTQTLDLIAPGGSTTFQITGAVVAAASGSIAAVETAQGFCGGSLYNAAQCLQVPAANPYVFTGTTLTPAQTYEAGQTISVTVTFSFQ